MADVAKFQWVDRMRVWGTRWKEKPEYSDPGIEFFKAMKAACDNWGIEFMCTPFHPYQVPLLDPLVKRWKIASANALDEQLWTQIEKTGKPIIVSTGFMHPEDIPLPNVDITVLACVSKYPAKIEDYKLPAWKERFISPHMEARQSWGVSDHSPGYTVPVIAASMGAHVIEKHLQLGFPHQPTTPDSGIWALEPVGFETMVKNVRSVEKWREGDWVPTSAEGRKVW